ncbi:HAD family hydrolase [bacterium]|nr:HAD family hydrolase [bacterium]
MLKAVLFDLDNTLVHFDESRFFDEYMRLLAPGFADLWPVETFRRRLIASVRALLDNDGTDTNHDRFMNHFCAGIDVSPEMIQSRFLRFYRSDFHDLKRLVTVPAGNRRLIEELRRRSLMIVIASNPVWPLDVQNIRLGWAGLDGFPFDRITHSGNTHFCKPRMAYYSEICRELNLAPESCLMVGNDPVNDMVVAEIGMRTYWVRVPGTDDGLPLSRELRKGEAAAVFVPDGSGPLDGIPDTVNRLLRTAGGRAGRKENTKTP